MPAKRKTKRKPPKRSKSQSQSQRQSVVVNIGKTTTTKRRRNAGRGGLPPPSHLQNLFPPTIIQQQAPNIAVLENQISRLTSLIQEPTGIKQPATPLGLDTRTAEAQRLAGQKAEERRPGPTAGNFQARPSVADERFDKLITEVDDLISQTPITDQPPVRPPDTAFTEQMVSDRDPPKMGEGGGGQPLSKREQRKAKTSRAKQRLEEDRQELIKLIDEGQDLTLEQSLLVNDPKLKLGKKRVKKGSMLAIKRK